jgi:pyruvate formate lyase activating enzyme
LPPIAGYHPVTLIDWPGRIAAIVFLPRCNLRCSFCHAGPLLGEPEETIPFEAVLGHLKSQAGWIDGIVICGGEPTVWPGIGLLCAAFQRAGLKVKLDTNGTNPERLAALLRAGLVDAIAMDLKAPLDERHHAITGTRADLGAINRSIDLVMESGVEYEFRTTVCPAFLGEEEIHAMGQRIAGARQWVLQRFEPAHALDPELRQCQPYGPARMESLAAIGRTYVSRCPVRGQPENYGVAVGRA